MIEILNIIKQVTGLPIFPLSSDKKTEQVIYKPVPVGDNGIKKQYRIELNIVAKTLANVEHYDDAIRKALLNIGNTTKVKSVTNIELNGGGTLTSEVGVHRLLFLSVTEQV